MNTRDRIEQGFAAWGHLVYRHAWIAIAAVLLLVAALASQLPKFQFDTTMEGFLHEDDPHRVAYDEFRENFGRDEMILVAIRTGGDPFRLDFLEKLRSFHEDIESEVPLLVDVTSLVNARNTRGEADELIVEDLLEEWPESEADLAAVRERALSNPLYRDQLLSADGGLTSLVIETEAFSQIGVTGEDLGGFEEEGTADEAEERPPLTGAENHRIVQALSRVAERYDGPGFELHIAGTPVLNDTLQIHMRTDMGRFTGLAILAIAIFLGVLFRRAAGVVLPVVVVALSVVSTIALMAALGVSLKLPTQILPSFLLAVGVGNSVHILAIFYQQRRSGASKEDAIAGAMGHSALAVVMTSLTTAGGLLSFVVAELAPIADLGVFGPIGVGVALAYTIVLLPALIAVFPMREEKPREEADAPFTQRLLVGCGEFATSHPGAIIGVSLAIVGFALVGAFRIEVSHDPIKWFQEDEPFRIANDLINEEMRGTMFLEAVIETGEENGLHDPMLLNRLQEAHERLDGIRVGELFVGKSTSLVDVVKEIHQALNENRPEYHAIPQNRQLVAQELLLFENSGSDDLEDVVDSQFSFARMTIKAPFRDANTFGPFIDAVETELLETLGDSADIELTGLMGIMGRTITAVLYSMIKSYGVALAVITPLMILLIGRFRIGLVSMVPNLSPIIVTMGIMGWGGIPLDPFTLMVGSIALGLAVDDTIHFLHNFRRYFERSGDVRLAVRETLQTTGQALLFTSLVLSTGFFLYTFSTMNNLFYFGLLTGLTIILALLADILLAPALMTLVARPRRVPEVGGATMEATQ